MLTSLRTRRRAVTRRVGVAACLLAAAAAGTAIAAAPARAAAVHPVAQIPAGAGGGSRIANVSQDGQRLLLVTSAPGGSAWLVDAGSATAAPAGASRYQPLANQSPSGSYVAWVPQAAGLFSACPRTAFVAPAGAATAPTEVALPPAYARTAINAIAVADDGAITARVSRCKDPTANRALLTGRPGQSQLTVSAAYHGHARAGSTWPISQDGRVFAACGMTSHRGKHVAELSVIDSRAPETVETARVAARDLPNCAVSDAGTATVTASRNGSIVGVTIAGTRKRSFSYRVTCRRGVGLTTMSADGTRAIVGFAAGRVSCPSTWVTVIDTRNGHSRSFPEPFRHLRAYGARSSPGAYGGTPFPADPFAPALLAMDPDSGVVGSFDLQRDRDGRPLKVMSSTHAGDASIDPCFLPSGRVLFVGTANGRYSLAITDSARSRTFAIDTTHTGPISSASCEAVKSTGQVFLATAAGRIYSVAANALDGSPLQPES